MFWVSLSWSCENSTFERVLEKQKTLIGDIHELIYSWKRHGGVNPFPSSAEWGDNNIRGRLALALQATSKVQYCTEGERTSVYFLRIASSRCRSLRQANISRSPYLLQIRRLYNWIESQQQEREKKILDKYFPEFDWQTHPQADGSDFDRFNLRQWRTFNSGVTIWRFGELRQCDMMIRRFRVAMYATPLCHAGTYPRDWCNLRISAS